MGAEGTYEGTYIGMLDHNATRIARALGGSAPEKGLHGRLTPMAHEIVNQTSLFSTVFAVFIAMMLFPFM